MAKSGQVDGASVGLGFGAEFMPIYQAHPGANLVAICQRNETKLNEIGDACGVAKRYTDYRDLLSDPDVDYVHINSPIGDHAPMAIAALQAGKHVLTEKLMGHSVRECKEMARVAEETGLPFASTHEGVMHACGHDAHMAMVLGTAKILCNLSDELSGTIRLIFQPAEEGPGGALPMIEAGVMNDPQVDYAIG